MLLSTSDVAMNYLNDLEVYTICAYMEYILI